MGQAVNGRNRKDCNFEEDEIGFAPRVVVSFVLLSHITQQFLKKALLARVESVQTKILPTVSKRVPSFLGAALFVNVMVKIDWYCSGLSVFKPRVNNIAQVHRSFLNPQRHRR